MTAEANKYFGKYRGTVFNNVDPLQQGRIQALVPDVLGDTPSSFAMACLPLAGVQMGHLVPVVGSGVWIEFEAGDPTSPIWTGCFYESAADLDGGPDITFKAAGGAFFTIDDAGISINNGKGATITLAGPSVDINDGALVIT